MSTQNSYPVYFTVPTNDNFANDISLNMSFPCKVWIVWLDTFYRPRPIRNCDIVLVPILRSS